MQRFYPDGNVHNMLNIMKQVVFGNIITMRSMTGQ